MEMNIFDQIEDPGPLPADAGETDSRQVRLEKELARMHWHRDNRRFQLAKAAKALDEIPDPPELVKAVIILSAMALAGEAGGASNPIAQLFSILGS